MHEDDATLEVNWWLRRGIASSMALNVAFAIAMTVMYCRRLPPYVFPVNADNQPVGVIQPVTSIHAIPDPLLRGWIAQFIRDAFTIDQAADEEKTLLDDTAARVTGQAHDYLNEWYNREDGKHNPATAYYTEQATVHVLATVKAQAPNEYDAYYETVTHRQGNDRPEQHKWHASLHLTTASSDDPLSTGVFVDSLRFEQEQ